MRSYRIYLYRHGKTVANQEGRYIGSTDEVLSEEGVMELLTLEKECIYPPVGKVYCSPMQRALQTARILYPEHTWYTVDGLREFHFGSYENKTFSGLSEEHPFFNWIQGKGGEGPTGAEDTGAFAQRVQQAFDEIVKDMMDRRIFEAAVVTHGGVLMALLAMCGLPKMPPAHWMVENGHGYSILLHANLWGNVKSFEICDPLPYQQEQERGEQVFEFYDVEDLKTQFRNE